MTDQQALVVGVDYGTLSGRAVVVRVSDGAELGSAVHEYPHAVMDHALTAGSSAEAGRAIPLPPDWALQVPADYVEVLRTAVPEALRQAKADHVADPADVIGIGTDFTACTMVPTAGDGTPLCELGAFADRPHAYVKLWKHHAAQPHADRINALAHERTEPWIRRYGGLISSEWEFAKGLQLLEEDPGIYEATEHWVEAADWIIWQLCGAYVRNACTAGYKGILQDGHYPSREFLAALNPDFADFVTAKVEHPTGCLAQLADRVLDLGGHEVGEVGVEGGEELPGGVVAVLQDALVAGGAGVAQVDAAELPDDPVRGLDPVLGRFVDLGVVLEQLQALGELPLRGDQTAVPADPGLGALVGEGVDPVGVRLGGVVLPELDVRVRPIGERTELAQRCAVTGGGHHRAGAVSYTHLRA